jgi:N6-adenosine-specific RNA methylase IME4
VDRAVEIIEPDVVQAADYVATAWRNGIEAILETGRRLIEIRDRFKDEPGKWSRLIGANQWKGQGLLPFGARHAYMLARVAEDERLVRHVSLLPSDSYTLYQLTRLSEDRFHQLIETKAIHPGMKRTDASAETRLERVQADEQRVLQLHPVTGKYRTLILDPAWDYEWLSLAGRAKPGYAMQTHEELLALDVCAWADEAAGCHLYLWTTNNFMGRACQLMAHWGFQHRTVLTWFKPPPFGLGSYFRNSTEHVLFGTLGETTTRAAAASIPTHFEAPRGEHSEKPERFYEIVRAASYPPFGEGNQREPRPDFTNLFAEELAA